MHGCRAVATGAPVATSCGGGVMCRGGGVSGGVLGVGVGLVWLRGGGVAVVLVVLFVVLFRDAVGVV